MSDSGPDHGNNRPERDGDDPYEDTDMDDLPEWWRRNIDTFRKHGMRPYRPPVFHNGDSLPSVVNSLEQELGISITVSKHVTEGTSDSWRISVDGEVVGSAVRTRDDSGQSVYSIDSDEFESIIRQAIEE